MSAVNRSPACEGYVSFPIPIQEKKLPKDIKEALSFFYPKITSKLTIETLKEGSVYKATEQRDGLPITTVVRKAFPTWTKERCQKEYEITRVFGDSNVGPKVINHTPDYRFMQIEYIEAPVLEPGAIIDLKEMGLTLRNLHKSSFPKFLGDVKTSTSFSRLHGQMRRLEEVYGTLPKSIYEMYYVALEYELKDKCNPKKVLCHLDLHYQNITRHLGKILFIDFGMSGPDHPYFDLANFAMYMNLSYGEEMELLKHYIGEDVDAKTWKEYAFYRPLVYLNKVTWVLILASKSGGNSKLIEEVWAEDSVMSLQEAFSWIYSGKERSKLEDTRYARAAYEQFFRKHEDYVNLCSQ